MLALCVNDLLLIKMNYNLLLMTQTLKETKVIIMAHKNNILYELVREFLSEAVNYYHKALHLGCCSSPRSASVYSWISSSDQMTL